MKKPLLLLHYSIIAVFLLFLSNSAFSQGLNKDSLSRVINGNAPDTARISALSDLAWELFSSVPDSALVLGTKALQLSEALPDTEKRRDHFIAMVSRDLGTINSVLGNYSATLDHYFRSLEISEKEKDKKAMSATYGNIGLVYNNLGDRSRAMQYYTRALQYARETGNKTGIASDLVNIGGIYTSMNKRDSAFLCFKQALVLGEELKSEYIIAACLANMGTYYSALHDHKTALDYYYRALALAEKNGDRYTIANVYGTIGSDYLHDGNMKLAEEYISKSLAMAKELGSINQVKTQESNIADMYYHQGRYKEAIDHYKNYYAARDSLYNEDNKRKSILSEINFEFGKKEALAKAEQEKKDMIAAGELKEQKRQRNYFIFGFALVVLIAVFIFINFRQKQKANILIAQQKQEVERQKHLVEQKHKEITDSINYAERIQRSFLATQELMKENLQEYFVFFQPKAVVSGDFYWGAKLKNGQFAFVTADSTGHGVPGAIMSILNISCLENAIESEQLSEPAKILDHTRKKIIERLKKDGSEEGGRDGMDCCLLCFDRQQNRISYSAANIPAWILRGKEIIELDADKMPVGKHERDQQPFTQHSAELQKGDMIYMITDGFPDQFGGPSGKKFMHRRLKETLIALGHLSMEEQKQGLLKALNDWKGNLEQVDDITVIGIRVNG
jgi:serine phosphatase RsbU (regulator of sigma subunit)